MGKQVYSIVMPAIITHAIPKIACRESLIYNTSLGFYHKKGR